MSELLKSKISGMRSIRKATILDFSEWDYLLGEWERIYNNLANNVRIDSAREYFLSHQEKTLEGTYILWGEYLDYYYLMCKKQAIGDKSFYKELQNDPRSTDDYIFQDIG